MGSYLEKWQRPPAGGSTEYRLVPARWLVVALAVVQLVLKRGALGKVGIATVLWSVAPRKLKLVAGGVAAGAAVVLLGAVAAIALLALHLA